MMEEPKDEALIEPSPPHNNDEIATWIAWLDQALDAGIDIAQLLQLEIRLAVGDLRRMLVLFLVALPMFLLTWISFVSLVAWLASEYFESVAAGLLTFLGIQIIVLIGLRFFWNRYKRSLRLPLTRQHLQAFLGGIRDEAQKVDT